MESESEGLILLPRVRLGSVEVGVMGVETADRPREPADKGDEDEAPPAWAARAAERLGDRHRAMDSRPESSFMVVGSEMPTDGGT